MCTFTRSAALWLSLQVVHRVALAIMLAYRKDLMVIDDCCVHPNDGGNAACLLATFFSRAMQHTYLCAVRDVARVGGQAADLFGAIEAVSPAVLRRLSDEDISRLFEPATSALVQVRRPCVQELALGLAFRDCSACNTVTHQPSWCWWYHTCRWFLRESWPILRLCGTNAKSRLQRKPLLPGRSLTSCR